MFWLPPVRFSTTTGWLQTPRQPWATARAMVSGEPPGVSGTMILTGRSGKPCASANAENSASSPASSHLVIFPPRAISRRTVYLFAMRRIRWSFTGGDPHADPRGTGQAVRRRVAVPVADPGAVRFERRVHAAPQSAQQKEFEARVKDIGARMAKKHGITPPQVLQDRRRHGGGVRGDEPGARQGRPADLRGARRAKRPTSTIAQARADGLKNQFVMDMHTHFLREGTPIRAFVAQREAVGKAGWNPALVGKPQTIDDLMFPNYVKEIFLDSDTKVACISGSYSEDEKFSFLANDMKRDAREKVNKESGTRRMFSHAIFTPGRDGWMEKVEEENARLKPDSWKGYTIGDNTNKHLAKRPFRLDDEKLMYPFYEKLVKWSKARPRPPRPEERLHPQGPVPAVGRAPVPAPGRLLQRGRRRPGGEGLAAAQLRHLSLGLPLGRRPGRHRRRGVGPAAARGRVDWVTDLAVIPEKFGVNNVYADLGQIFAHSNMAEPRVAAYMLGIMIKGMGADHVVWGTDSLWTGAPQWQIEALRRMEIPDEIQKKYGLAPMGPANGPVKTRDPRRQQRPPLRLHAEDAGALENDRSRTTRVDLREARRRAHQPRLRLHQQRLPSLEPSGPKREPAPRLHKGGWG